MGRCSFYRVLLGFSLSLLMALPVQSGWFDNLKRQAEKAISDTTNDVINSVTGDSEKEVSANEDLEKKEPANKTTSHEDDHKRHVVREIQKGLAQLGYDVGNPDGIAGRGTRRAIEKYQTDKQLKVDGEPTQFIYDHVRCTLGNSRGCRNVKMVMRPIEQRKQEEQWKQQAAQQQQRFDAYSGPATIGHNNRQLMQVRFNKQAYQLKDKNGGRNYKLTDLLKLKYQKEWRSIRNEFDMHREIPKLHRRLMDEADNAPTTYRTVHRTPLEPYDFNRQVFPVTTTGSRLVTFDRVYSGKIYLPIGMDSAEQFKNYTRGTVFIERVYEVVGISIDGYSRPLAHVKSLKVFKNGLEKTGKETLLNNLIMNIPISELDPYPPFALQGGQPALSDSGDNDNSIQINF